MVIASFAGPIDRHRTALAQLLPSDARLSVRQVVNARDELLALKDVVVRNEGWLKTIKAELESAGVDTERNLVKVEISSPNPDAANLIIDHFGGQGRMYVVSDGVGVAFLPIGTLVIVARDSRDRPVPGLTAICTGDLPNTGTGDIGIPTDQQGMWRSRLRATGYTCQLWGGGRIVGTGHAVVEGGTETGLRITTK